MTLDELQRICDDATPGRWRVERGRYPSGSALVVKDPIQDNPDPSGPEWFVGIPSPRNTENDMEFIAAARTYLPKLIAVARAAKLFQQWYNAEEEEDDAFDDEKISEAAEKIDDSLDALGEQSP